MNIAILIGVSKYASEAGLPACALDAENMRALLTATRKYDDIQVITEHTNASQLKDALRHFFAKYQNLEPINEAFVYFSGHGIFQNDALLCCSDFDINRPATTSISNAELDDLLRSVKPAVAVKVIDACQSGSPYIKDASTGFEKALGGSQLNSFICMASSRQNQASFASSTESFFTAKWIDAALSKVDGSVLYRDIQAALADAFVQTPEQTPFFVSQGTGLEAFSSVTEEMSGLSASRRKSISPEKSDDAVSRLIETEIKLRDKQFVPHPQALQAVEASKSSLITTEISDTIVARFYNLSVKTDGKFISIPKSKSVAEFAEKQGWSKRYFARINQETYKVRILKDPMSAVSLASALKRSVWAQNSEDEYTIETRQRPASLEVTEPLPLEVAELSFTSSHPSLPAFIVYIGIVHSLTEIMVLSSIVRLVQKGWESRAPELSDVQWKYRNYAWTEIVTSPNILWQEAKKSGESDIRKYLESLANKDDASCDDATSASKEPEATV